MKVTVMKIGFREQLLLLVVFCALDKILGQDCDSKIYCDECIQELNCFWCTVANGAKSHCIPRTNLASCNAEHTEDPKRYDKILENRPLTETKQISPQRVKLTLRRNEKFEIDFSYKQSDNYPVDLYYLMDVSNSMATSKQQLADLGKELAAEMEKKTNNFKIGFGSFVDKLTLPYVNTHPDALKKPCEGCAAPYSFKNHLSLQSNAELFSTSVKNTQLSGNLDSPEGGFDAIMQAIVCREEIGWRPNARHLLVMSTDAVSHIAGDGKLGGVIEPNDAKCHMDSNSYYTEGLVYDYPSVSHINYVARQNNINLIFAIVTTSNDPTYLVNHYEAMSHMIENSKTGTLDQKKNNVVKFISDIYDEGSLGGTLYTVFKSILVYPRSLDYTSLLPLIIFDPKDTLQKIRDSVKITSDATKDVSVTINSTCPSFVNGACSNVKPGQTLNFKAIIEPLLCHKDAELNKKTITIKPEGLQDSLVIELEVTCDCNCAANRKANDPACTSLGDLECGTCRCNEGRFGKTCECDRETSQTTDVSACVKPDGRNLTCSGNGKCFCGKCSCLREHYDGKYCEYDTTNCGNPKCSDHGKCNSGKCDCYKDWSGDICDCSRDKSQCYAPGGDKECSGNGKCTCGKCQCNVNAKTRYNMFCEVTTPKKSCADLKLCVQCLAYKTGIYANNTDCTLNCKNYNVTTVKELEVEKSDGVERCRLAVEKNCDIRFEFSEVTDDTFVVTAVEEKICWTPISPLVWILAVIAVVLLIGIVVLLAWKIITTAHDKNEYAKFLAERNETTFVGENPLYKPGTSHFQNPAYLRASQRASVMIAAKKSEPASEETNFKEK